MTAKKCRDFSAEEVVRAPVLNGAIRASDCSPRERFINRRYGS
jgi:hypothetical protein